MSDRDDAPAENPGFVQALVLPNLGRLALAKSLLEQAEIRYFVRNERTQSLFGWGEMGAGYNLIVGPPVIMVEAARVDDARELLTPLLGEPEPGAPGTE